MGTNTAGKLATAMGIYVAVAGAILAQTSPPPGPSGPPLRVPKGGESLVINPTRDECRAGWRPGLRWSKAEFTKFCHQMKISK
jgi:hypothetical protein